MKAICIEDKKSTQLLKGRVYQIISIWDEHEKIRKRFSSRARFGQSSQSQTLLSHYSQWGLTETSQHWVCNIKGLVGSFDLNQFNDMDKNPIKEREYLGSPKYYWLRKDNITEGQILKCKTKELKTLTFGKFYHVDKIHEKSSKIQLKEIHGRWYSTYNFEEIPKDELRDMNIGELMGDSDEISVKTKNYDEIDHLNDKENWIILFEGILDAINYLEKTSVEGATIQDVIKKRSTGKSSIDISDFEKVKNIDWEKLFNYTN